MTKLKIILEISLKFRFDKCSEVACLFARKIFIRKQSYIENYSDFCLDQHLVDQQLGSDLIQNKIMSISLTAEYKRLESIVEKYQEDLADLIEQHDDGEISLAAFDRQFAIAEEKCDAAQAALDAYVEANES